MGDLGGVVAARFTRMAKLPCRVQTPPPPGAMGQAEASYPEEHMRSVAEEIARLSSEIARLNEIVDAAKTSGRDVRLQRALLVQHAIALGDLEKIPPGSGQRFPSGLHALAARVPE